MAPETLAGIHSDPFASYFSDCNPNTPPKVLTTTSPKAAEVTYKLSEELVDVFPVAESVRKKGRGFEIGGNAGWGNAVVLNEDVKKPNGPTTYFKLTSIELSDRISLSPFKMPFVEINR